jgi:hypothetical protein
MEFLSLSNKIPGRFSITSRQLHSKSFTINNLFPLLSEFEIHIHKTPESNSHLTENMRPYYRDKLINVSLLKESLEMIVNKFKHIYFQKKGSKIRTLGPNTFMYSLDYALDKYLIS